LQLFYLLAIHLYIFKISASTCNNKILFLFKMHENLISEQDNKNLSVSVNPDLCVCFLYIFLVFNILLSGSFAILKCLFERGT